jgi:addiction module RelB/DinJ family antitoxin
MNTASIFVKTDPRVKEEARKTAEELGFSLSSIINAFLRQFVKTKTINFSALSEEEPSDYLIETIKKSEEDIKQGRVSPDFHDTKEAIEWLNKE